MIKHVILVGNGGCYAEGVSDYDVQNFYEDPGTAILVADHISNGGSFLGKDITFKHKDMVTVFPLPAKRSDFLSVTCYPLVEMFGKNKPRTNVEFTANESFNLPNVVIENGMIKSTTIDTEGKIIPGIYGFMLVKKNVPFNKRNKWYIEVIIKEDTSYSDFATLLDGKFKEIDSNLSIEEDDGTFILATNNSTDKAYDLMFDDLAKFAFTKVSSIGVNNRGRHFLRKLCREADANYGFNYTTVEGTELYKNRTDEMYNELFTLSQEEDCTLYVLNIKFNEPSYYRTVDEKINKVITIIADWSTIYVLITALQLTIDNKLINTNDDNEDTDGNVYTYDVDNSGTVDIDDLNIVINVILRKNNASDYNDDELTYENGNPRPRCDVNGDGVVDIDDMNLVINRILRKTSKSVAQTNITYLANALPGVENAISDAVSFLSNKYMTNSSAVTYNGVADAAQELIENSNQ